MKKNNSRYDSTDVNLNAMDDENKKTKVNKQLLAQNMINNKLTIRSESSSASIERNKKINNLAKQDSSQNFISKNITGVSKVALNNRVSSSKIPETSPTNWKSLIGAMKTQQVGSWVQLALQVASTLICYMH